jgi:putative copper export protein
MRRLALLSSLALVLVTAALLAQQAAAASGEGMPAALGTPLLDLLGTSTGFWWLTRLLLLVLLLLHLRRAPVGGPGRRTWWIGLALGALILATFTAASHAGSESENLLASPPGDFVHLLAVTCWLGGLVPLVLSLRISESAFAATQLILAFSRLALGAVVLITLTGVAAALARIGSLEGLVSTTYGVALLAKLGLMAVLLSLGALNRFVLIPRLKKDGQAERGLRLSALTEAAFSLILLFAVSVLTASAPAEQALEARWQEGVAAEASADGVSFQMRLTRADHLDCAIAIDLLPQRHATPATSVAPIVSAVISGSGDAIRTFSLPTHDHQHFFARGGFFPEKGKWRLEVVITRPGRPDVIQPFLLPAIEV